MFIDERLIGKNPGEAHLKKSRAHLERFFKERTETWRAGLAAQKAIKGPVLDLTRGLTKDDPRLAETVKLARAQAEARAKERVAAPFRRKVPPRGRLGSIAVTLTPPFWPWQWDSESGSASGTAYVDPPGGYMAFDAWTGSDGKTASSRVAMGGYFQPMADNGVMDVFANPAIAYDVDTWTVLDSASASGFVGLYVGEYTLDGEFTQSVIDQTIDITSVTGGNTGQISGFCLSGSTPVDSDHFYEIWVWAGGDASADGWSEFWGSAALSKGNLTLPSISIYAY